MARALMHILHIIDSLAPGGAERMLVDLANAAHDAGERASVCITRSTDTLARELRPAIAVTVLHRQRRVEIARMRALDALARDADLLHIHGRSSLSFVVACKTIGLLRGVPALLHDHYGKIEIDFSVPSWFRLWGRGFVDQYVGVSARLGEWARAAGLPAARIQVIENRLDLSRMRAVGGAIDLRAAFGLNGDPVAVLVCGIRHEKGVDLAIDALDGLPGVNLLIVGADNDPAYAAACRQQVIDRGLAGRVIFTGPRSDVPRLLAGADCALMASRSESGPLTLIEYVAAGLPIVSARAGSIGIRLAEAGVPGFFTPGSSEALRAALADVIRLTPDARRARGAEGAAIGARLFDLSGAFPDWLTLYRRMTNPEQTPR